MLSKSQKKKSIRNLFKRNTNKSKDDEALDASLMRKDRKAASAPVHFDQAQIEMLEKLYDYHRIDINRLKKKFRKSTKLEAFIRNNQIHINDARTSNMVILGTSGSGKTKVWWNFLNHYRKSYLDSNNWGLSPKDFYYIITEKIMNISVDILIEYNYHRKLIEKPDCKENVPTTCLSKNDLQEWKQYKLELEDADVKEGYDFFQDLISKLSKITSAINTNIQLEENKKLDGDKPNWDKIQELRNIEKEIKEFKPSTAPKIKKLWKSKALREMYLYQYGLHNSRNLFYFVDNMHKFASQKQRTEEKTQTKDDAIAAAASDAPIRMKPTFLSSKSISTLEHLSERHTKTKKWEWEWSFEEILRCQIRTTGVIESYLDLGPFYEEEMQKNFSLKIRLWDVGGAQNERKKWKYVLNANENTADIDCVIFVVNLMSYYKKSWEADKNGLLQSLQLFACLLSYGDTKHHDEYHTLKENSVKKDEIAMNLNDPIALARQISHEEYNICIDNQVKRAMNDISLIYLIFTDTEGLEQMLKSGSSFKQCFSDYDGDNSVIDVQSFIEKKFQNIVDEANDRIKEKNDRLSPYGTSPAAANEDVIRGAPIYSPRKGSIDNDDNNTQKKKKKISPKAPSMRRMQTVPLSVHMRDKKEKKEDAFDGYHSDFDLSDDGLMDENEQMHMEGQKRLKCRFVSVIDHDEMKHVMNEIVKSSFLNKNALDPVVHSFI